MPRRAPWPLCAAVALALVGCAAVPPVTPPAREPTADAPFGLEGRLSARRGRDGISVAFTWNHSPPRDEFALSTPLGQSVAELRGDTSIPRVEVRTAEGRHDEAPDWSTLTERVVGFPLPVEGLAAWAQGAPHAGSAHTVEADTVGRTGVLRQDGCEIVYSYADDAAIRPSLLRVTCNDVELRIVLDRWRTS
jgi:outer membrane lipoprotein LolB